MAHRFEGFVVERGDDRVWNFAFAEANGIREVAQDRNDAQSCFSGRVDCVSIKRIADDRACRFQARSPVACPARAALSQGLQA